MAKGDPYWMTAKFGGIDGNGKPVRAGAQVFYYPITRKMYQGEEAQRAYRAFVAAAEDEQFMVGNHHQEADPLRCHRHPNTRLPCPKCD